MSLDFADTCFWVALANPKDELHNKAIELSKKHIKILTTQEVLGEFLNFFSSKGAIFRSKAVEMVSAIQSDPNITQSLLIKDWNYTKLDRINNTACLIASL